MQKQTKKQAYKQNTTNFIIYLVVTAIFFVIGSLIKSDWKYALFFLGVVAFGMAFYNLFNGIARINRTFCPRCDTMYSYHNYDICWEEHSTRQDGYKAYSTVDFYCKCPNCSYEIRYSKQFCCAKYNQDLNCWEKKDVYKWAENLFWNGLD